MELTARRRDASTFQRAAALLRGGKPRSPIVEAGADAELVLFVQAFVEQAWLRRVPLLPIFGPLVYDEPFGASWLGLGCSVVHAERLWDLSARECELLGLIGQDTARRIGARVEWGGSTSWHSWCIRDWRGLEVIPWPLSGGLRKVDILGGKRGCSPARALVGN